MLDEDIQCHCSYLVILWFCLRFVLWSLKPVSSSQHAIVCSCTVYNNASQTGRAFVPFKKEEVTRLSLVLNVNFLQSSLLSATDPHCTHCKPTTSLKRRELPVVFQELAYLMYNDELPDSKSKTQTYGHTKGGK